MKTPLVLRTVIGKYDHVLPLKDRSISSDRLRLEFVEVDPLNEAFRRMVRNFEFDVCEMAITTHALAHAFDRKLTALPIILHRGFHQATLVCGKDSKLKGPEELQGKRIAVRAYSQTTGVWVRGILSSVYGIDLDKVTWVTLEDAHVPEYVDPPNVERAPAGANLKNLLATGNVEAVIGFRNADPATVRPVIPDPDVAAAEWFRKTGIYPGNHAVSVKDELLVEHPWLADELMSFFAEAKARSYALKRAKPAAPVADTANARLMALVGEDRFPYGMAANRASIEMLLRFATEQKLIPRAYGIEELFDAQSIAS